VTSDITQLVTYGLDDVGQSTGLVGMTTGDTLSPEILDTKVLAASGTMAGVVGGTLTELTVCSTQANIKNDCTWVYNAALDRVITQVAPFVADPIVGGPFSEPTQVSLNSSVAVVNMPVTLSGGPDAYFGNVHASGEVGVSGTTTLNDTVSVSSQNSVANIVGALPTLDTLISPHLIGSFCFLSSVGDGTAGTSEINFGEGTTIQGVSSVGRAGSNGFYAWNKEESELGVSADGIYKVDFVGITEVAAAITITISFYTGSTLVHRFDLRVHSVTDPHNLVGSWVGFVQTSAPISVTINSGSGDNAQLMESSTLFVQRLA